MPATKIVQINLIGVADKFAKSSNLELNVMRLELVQMCEDLMAGDAILAPGTEPESLLALSMMLVFELAQRGNHAL